MESLREAGSDWGQPLSYSPSYSLTFTPVIGSMRSALTDSADSSESSVELGMSLRIGLDNDERTWGMLSCRRRTPATRAPPRKKNGIWVPALKSISALTITW